MNKIAIATFRRTALAAALLTAFGAHAQDADLQKLVTPESSIAAGLGIWTGDRHAQGVYDGMRDGKGYGLLDATLIKRDNATGTWLDRKSTV